MLRAILVFTSMVISVPVSYASAPSYPPPWGFQGQPERRVVQSPVRRHHTRTSRQNRRGGGSAPPASVAKLQADIVSLRRELADIRAEVGRPTPENTVLAPSIALWGLVSRQKPVEKAVEPSILVDLGLPSLSSEPLPAPFPSRLQGVEEADRVRGARAYLVRTATIGLTMARQGPETAIGRLHPDFAVKLADAIKRAREAGLPNCGVFSAYRPPAFGIGGFSNKFNSLHSYGLAADIAGIGSPGSHLAHLWQKIVYDVGLFLPYGPDNHAEWNHTQLISNKVADTRLHRTITSSAPKDLREMWAASGIKNFIPIEAAVLGAAR